MFVRGVRHLDRASKQSSPWTSLGPSPLMRFANRMCSILRMGVYSPCGRSALCSVRTRTQCSLGKKLCSTQSLKLGFSKESLVFLRFINVLVEMIGAERKVFPHYRKVWIFFMSSILLSLYCLFQLPDFKRKIIGCH